MSEEIKQTAVEIAEEERFGGFTLEELRYRRAVADLKKQFAHAKIGSHIQKIQKKNPFAGGGSSMLKAGGMAGKLLTGLSYVDYAMIGFSIFNTGRKIFSFFRKKK